MKLIIDGITFDWNDADSEGIMYISKEGGYQAKTKDSYDLYIVESLIFQKMRMF